MSVNGANHNGNKTNGEPNGVEISLEFRSSHFEELKNQLGVQVEMALRIFNHLGQKHELGPVPIPLAELNPVFSANPGALNFTACIPWDGNDAEGHPFTGGITIHYHAELIGVLGDAKKPLAAPVFGRISFNIR